MALVLCVAVMSTAYAEGINVVFIPKLSGNAFFESANVGAQDFAAKNGFTVTYDGNPEASAANQVAIIQNAITNGADAICISTVDAAGVDDALKEAAAAGLTVTTWDSDANPEHRSIMSLKRVLVAVFPKVLSVRITLVPLLAQRSPPVRLVE